MGWGLAPAQGDIGEGAVIALHCDGYSCADRSGRRGHSGAISWLTQILINNRSSRLFRYGLFVLGIIGPLGEGES
jgi:hypothetical protein